MNFFFIVFIVVAVIILVKFLGSSNKAEKTELLLKDIQNLYFQLNEVALRIYKLENCPNCFGDIMEIRRVTPSGKSIEYQCVGCKEVISKRIIKGKDYVEALHIQNKVKIKLTELYSLIGEEVHNKNIDTSFSINPEN